MSSLGSRHLVSSNRFVRCSTSVDMRRSPVCTRFRSTPSPMIPSFLVCVGPTSSGVRSSRESLGEVGDQVLLGWILPVAGDSRERDLQVVALGAYCLHLHRLLWLARANDHRTGGEVEGNAQHVGIFDVKLVVLVQFVGLAPERPAHHLFAQELRSEGPGRPGRG